MLPESQRHCRTKIRRSDSRDFIHLAALLAVAVLAITASRAFAGDGRDEHAAHAAPSDTKTSMSYYTIPAVHLVREDGKEVLLSEEMNDGRPVVLNFIFTTCSSVCPLMSQVFAQFERKLGADRDKVHLMSISIDPEEDTPARLREYARKFSAGPEWQHYTGTVRASTAAQSAFDVYRGAKMSHTAVTFLRARPGQPWVRVDGFVTPDELLQQYQRLLEQSGKALAQR